MDATRSDPDFTYRMLLAEVHRGRRHHHQHPRHRRLRHPRGVRASSSAASDAERQGHRQRSPSPFTATTTSASAPPTASPPSLAGARQVEVHHQRHRRARRQRLTLKRSSWPSRPAPTSSTPTTGINTEHLVPALAHGRRLLRHARPAQQGHRRPQRLPPSVRHPPGRRRQAARELRDHGPQRPSAGPRARQFVLSKLSGRAGFRVPHRGPRLRARRPRRLARAFMKFQAARRQERPSSTTATSRRSSSDQPRPRRRGLAPGVASTVTTGTATTPTASIKLRGPDGETFTPTPSTGTGPVDAVYRTIRKITGMDDRTHRVRCPEPSPRASTPRARSPSASDADDSTYTGRASDTDILVASAQRLHERHQPLPPGRLHAQVRRAGG